MLWKRLSIIECIEPGKEGNDVKGCEGLHYLRQHPAVFFKRGIYFPPTYHQVHPAAFNLPRPVLPDFSAEERVHRNGLLLFKPLLGTPGTPPRPPPEEPDPARAGCKTLLPHP